MIGYVATSCVERVCYKGVFLGCVDMVWLQVWC